MGARQSERCLACKVHVLHVYGLAGGEVELVHELAVRALLRAKESRQLHGRPAIRLVGAGADDLREGDERQRRRPDVCVVAVGDALVRTAVLHHVIAEARGAPEAGVAECSVVEERRSLREEVRSATVTWPAVAAERLVVNRVHEVAEATLLVDAARQVRRSIVDRRLHRLAIEGIGADPGGRQLVHDMTLEANAAHACFALDLADRRAELRREGGDDRRPMRAEAEARVEERDRMIVGLCRQQVVDGEPRGLAVQVRDEAVATGHQRVRERPRVERQRTFPDGDLVHDGGAVALRLHRWLLSGVRHGSLDELPA